MAGVTIRMEQMLSVFRDCLLVTVTRDPMAVSKIMVATQFFGLLRGIIAGTQTMRNCITKKNICLLAINSTVFPSVASKIRE